MAFHALSMLGPSGFDAHMPRDMQNDTVETVIQSNSPRSDAPNCGLIASLIVLGNLYYSFCSFHWLKSKIET